MHFFFVCRVCHTKIRPRKSEALSAADLFSRESALRSQIWLRALGTKGTPADCLHLALAQAGVEL